MISAFVMGLWKTPDFLTEKVCKAFVYPWGGWCRCIPVFVPPLAAHSMKYIDWSNFTEFRSTRVMRKAPHIETTIYLEVLETALCLEETDCYYIPGIDVLVSKAKSYIRSNYQDKKKERKKIKHSNEESTIRKLHFKHRTYTTKPYWNCNDDMPIV